MPCFVQHAMVPMPFALVRLMADYAETDYGNMFVFGRSNDMTTSDTLYLIRLPDVDDEDCNYGDPARARLDELERKYDIHIQSINYPTVARGTERLRIVPNPHHTPEMIRKLIHSLVDVWKKLGLKLQ